MFVRKKRSPSNPNTYVQLIENYRADGKVRQKVIKHIGTAVNDSQLEKLMFLGEQLKALFEKNTSEKDIELFYQQEISKIVKNGSDILNCDKVQKKIKGIHDIYGQVLEDFNLKNICDWNQKYYDAFKDIVMARIATPSSKREAAKNLKEDFGINITLNTIYRMMDKLDQQSILNAQKCIADYNTQLVGNKINILFYDVTTIYFESFSSDELKKLGYSKDNKFNQPQIVLTLLVTDKGLPLGYQLLPGNTYEGHTLLAAIDTWQTIYPNTNFVLVADSGMLNNDNLSTLDAKGIDYIVCARIKNLPKATKNELLEFKESREQGKDFFHCLEFSNRKLILSYKYSRAKKDQHDREKALDQLTSKLNKSKNPTNLINNYGYKRFINIDGNSKVILNEEKIKESERWDGLHGLITNIKDITPETAYHHYKNLWQIEDAFRINKSDLKIRPVFHWTEARIHAHIFISYAAYACYKAVEYKVNSKNATNYSHREIKNFLKKVSLDIFKDRYSNNYYAIPEPISEATKIIYKTFNKEPEELGYCCTLEMAS